MNLYKLVAIVYCATVALVNAQTPCDTQLEEVEILLKQATPFNDGKMVFNTVEPCAVAGHAKAENYLGVLYLNGIGVAKDESKAFSLINSAAKKGYAGAQYNLGRLYKYGLGCTINFETAVAWFKKGAANGSPKSAYALGYMYYKGFGVVQDYTKALKWLKKSDDPMAKHYLGLANYLGYGVSANETRALEVLLDNPTANSKALVTAIRAEQKAKQEAQTAADLEAQEPESYPIKKDVVMASTEELQYYPEVNVDLQTIVGAWEGKLVELDWSGAHIQRVMPIEFTVQKDSLTSNIEVQANLEHQKINTTAQWQNETLYLEQTDKAVTLNRLYPETPEASTLDYTFFSASLQPYEYDGVTYLIGTLDAYIPSWKEYGKPMSLILKPIGQTHTLSEDALLALAAQKDQFIKLYPVPFNTQLTVQYELEESANVSIELVRLNGSHHINILQNVFQRAGLQTFSVPVQATLPEGVYVVRVTVGSKLYTRMLIKDSNN